MVIAIVVHLKQDKNGKGIYKWKSGDKYNGNWANDQMDGTGTYTYSNGIKVKGEFKANKFISGAYKIKNKNGRYTFTIEDGKATFIYAILKNGVVYEGEMKDGRLDGDARIKYSNGDRYEGQIKKDKNQVLEHILGKAVLPMMENGRMMI